MIDRKTIREAATTCLLVLRLMRTMDLLGLIFIPIATTFLNIWFNKMLTKEIENVFQLMMIKIASDYFSVFLQGRIARFEAEKLIICLNMGKLKCGVPIPGITQKKHEELIDDQMKLHEFLFVLPITWSTLISFTITIYNLQSNGDFPVRSFFTSLSVLLFLLMTYLTDTSLYQRTKPCSKTITSIYDTSMVKMKLSMACTLDENHNLNKGIKQENQMNIQNYIICFLNLVITYFSIVQKDIANIYSFGGVSWMISCLSNNIKSFQYYGYMKEFLNLCQCYETHVYKFEEPRMAIGEINSVRFENATFGYFADNLDGQEWIPRIKNLSFSFQKGSFYYLEAPNGIGKSTILRMFQSNLIDGSIFFGSVNRKNLTFEDMSKCVFHIVQASEYTPRFLQEEIESFEGKDKWLEERLGLVELFKKATVEMSGGQKKRMFIYMVLTSGAPILLLDEILSELSKEETNEVPEGGGWLKRVINTLVSWHGLKNKIVVLVGHGIVDLIPNKNNIVKLQLKNDGKRTFLYGRN